MSSGSAGSGATSPGGSSGSGVPSASSASGGGVAGGGANGVGVGGNVSVSSGAASPCCDSGRPLVTDPVTGQTVCSCQYERLQALQNAYGPSAAAAAARLAAVSSAVTSGVSAGLHGVYSAAYPSSDQNPYPSLGMDTTTAFYSSLVSLRLYWCNAYWLGQTGVIWPHVNNSRPLRHWRMGSKGEMMATGRRSPTPSFVRKCQQQR